MKTKNLQTKTSWAKVCLVFLLGVMGVGMANAQFAYVDGDYRTLVASATWSTASHWQVRSGGAWATASSAPTSSNNVYVQAGHAVTLTAAAACNNLVLQNGGSLRLALGANNLSVNGLIAAATQSSATITTADGTLPVYATANSGTAGWITNNGGKIIFVGTTRTLTISGAWGAQAESSTATNSCDYEINTTNSTDILTLNTGLKGKSITVTKGVLKVAVNTASLAAGLSSGGTGAITIAANGTIESNATGTSNLVIQRSGNSTTGYLGTLTVNGKLKLTGAAPYIGCTSLTGSGIIEYGASAAQTFLTAGNGGTESFATYASTLTVTLSGSGVKTPSAATTINGILDLQGTASLAASPVTSYGSASTLIYDQGTAQSLGAEWSAAGPTAGAGVPQNVIVQNGTTLTIGSARALSGTLTVGTTSSTAIIAAAYTGASSVTGTLQLNTSGSVSAAPTYSGTSSALIYNEGGSITQGSEWNGTTATVGAGVPQNVTIQNSTTVTTSAARALTGTLTVASGSTIALGNGYTAGAMSVAGTLKLNSGGYSSSTPTYSGTGSLIYNTGGTYGIGSEWTGGGTTIGSGTPYNVTLQNNTTINLTATRGMAGALTVANGSTISNTNGINTSSGGSISGTLQINQGGYITGGTVAQWNYNSAGTLVFNNSTGLYSLSGANYAFASTGLYNVQILGAGGVDFVSGTQSINGLFTTQAYSTNICNLTFNGGMQLNSGYSFGGSCGAGLPAYGCSSTLTYNSGGNPTRGTEWNTGNMPGNVTISNNTTLNGNIGNGSICGTLTIGSGSKLYMDQGSSGSSALTVGGSVILNGDLSLGFNAPGDMNVAGNWTHNSGTFNSNSRSVAFNGTTAQTITATGGETFAYLNISNTSATVTAANNIAVSNQLQISTGATLDMATNALSGAFTNSGTGTLKTQNTGSTPVPSGKTWTQTVEYNSASAQTLMNGTYAGLTASAGSTKTMSGAVTVSGALAFSGNSKVAINGNTLTLNGTVSGMDATNSLVGSNSSKLTVGATSSLGTVYFDQSTDAKVSTTDGTNALSDLVVSGAGGSVTLGNKVNLFGKLAVSNASATLNTGDYLVLRSISTGSAYVDVVPSGAIINGQVTHEKYLHLPHRGWRMLTAPVTYNGISTGSVYGNWGSNFGYGGNYGTNFTANVTPSTSIGIDYQSNSANLLTYNSSGSGSWNVINNTVTEAMSGSASSAANKGFFIFVRGDRSVGVGTTTTWAQTTLAAKGKLQTGTQTFTYGGASGVSWIVGNPYASPVDMSTVSFTNGGTVCYVWDPNLTGVSTASPGAYNSFQINNFAAGPIGGGSMSQYFQSGQAFLIKPTSTTASVVFNESNKSNTYNAYTDGSQNNITDMFNVILYAVQPDGSRTNVDGVRAIFGSNYNNAVDMNEDGLKASGSIESISLLRENKKLVLEARPYIVAEDSLFLSMANMVLGGNYEFKIDPINFDASVSECKIIDNFLQTETAVSLTGLTVYPFSITSATGSNAANRFTIVFKGANPLANNKVVAKGYRQNNTNIVNWTLNTEDGIANYVVERSNNGRDYTAIKSQELNNKLDYSYTDKEATAATTTYYRIKLTMKDGKYSYSNVVTINNNSKQQSGFAIYPNPVENAVVGLQLTGLAEGKAQVTIYNNLGQMMYNTNIAVVGTSSSTQIELNKTLAAGSYQIQITDSKGISFKQTMLKK